MLFALALSSAWATALTPSLLPAALRPTPALNPFPRSTAVFAVHRIDPTGGGPDADRAASVGPDTELRANLAKLRDADMDFH